jgi:hypothetical protein
MLRLFTILAVAWFCFSCGSGDKPTAQPTPPTTTQPSAGYPAVKAIVDAKCVRCHDGVVQRPSLKTEAEVLAVRAKVKAEVAAGAMPPGSPLPAGDKAAFDNL